MLTPEIIFEDESLLVILKPAGWVVNDAKTVKTTFVVQNWLSKNFKYPIVDNYECRNGVVHRLDKETSGILLVAKDKDAFENLQSQFKNRSVQKTYLALLHGVPKKPKGTIDAPVGRLPWNRERFGVYSSGRQALSDYEVVEVYVKGNEKYSLTKFYPKTGRTHQIRVHAKYLGNPIVSDKFYAGRKTARKDSKFCQRLFLHASEIVFSHPRSGEKLTFSSDLPSDLQEALRNLSSS
ncbi:MAG: RluA family pseudouridine synthase [Patescibacteria group bacterium]|nr:RluA family pseudouridine synthase [Patescibacteria group bacterium]